MEYYFEQLKQPLRMKQSAKAIEITNTLTSGRIPEGISFPEPNRDWSYLLIDEIVFLIEFFSKKEVGQYLLVPGKDLKEPIIGKVEGVDRKRETVQLSFYKSSQCDYQKKSFRPEELRFIEENHFYKNLADNGFNC